MILIAVHERPAAVLRCLAASCGFQTDRNIAHHHNNFILQVATASFSSRYYIFKISTCILTYLHNFTLGKTFSSFLHNVFNPAEEPKQPIRLFVYLHFGTAVRNVLYDGRTVYLLAFS